MLASNAAVSTTLTNVLADVVANRVSLLPVTEPVRPRVVVPMDPRAVHVVPSKKTC